MRCLSYTAMRLNGEKCLILLKLTPAISHEFQKRSQQCLTLLGTGKIAYQTLQLKARDFDMNSKIYHQIIWAMDESSLNLYLGNFWGEVETLRRSPFSKSPDLWKRNLWVKTHFLWEGLFVFYSAGTTYLPDLCWLLVLLAISLKYWRPASQPGGICG